MEPAIQRQNPGILPAVLSTRRRELWPSREAAAESFKKSKFYQAWDTRVLDRWIEYGLREVPTALIPSKGEPNGANDTSVTLTTTKHQELHLYMRPTYRGDAQLPPEDDKANYADFDPSVPKDYPNYPFYRPEPAYVFDHLPQIRPSVLYVFARNSDFGRAKGLEPSDGWRQKVERTGVGVGGGGGLKLGQVKQAVIPDSTHMVPFEKVEESADEVVHFLDREVVEWKKKLDVFKKKWMEKPQAEKATIDQCWIDNIDPNRTTSNAGSRNHEGKL